MQPSLGWAGGLKPTTIAHTQIQTGDVLKNQADPDLHSIPGATKRKQNIPMAGSLIDEATVPGGLGRLNK